jgi:hypothetical protein
MLRPSTIVVWLHETIETSACSKQELEGLRDRVWRTVAGPIHFSLNEAFGKEREPQTEAKA